ncbi:hypothetical protein SPRG_06855 [Saprolegnia parasitica CBS 223.65]|uniref:RING-type domain-containing protein n=1 Tax=Saprolegnia parasitica (strain CBS 223.65) TaxID=695850 RepID=A0A067CLA5_SAPPC|nr:hypothetical protein SPRG_06855 [Saprolegnia parasitica CBS 223.65]KDO27587.1 hypothetical protein SPRG_06855 [Saprolegnia parasitica CBS 223.65]|eukprot:XP_012201712.1 hypothetical protein SPRG_06855 [Saprolegnia parasitica CBS 223.65]
MLTVYGNCVQTRTVFSGDHAFTRYDFELVFPVTQRRWTVRKRYSDCLRFRRQLQKWAAHARGRIVLRVRALLATPFPRKRFDNLIHAVLSERSIGLKQFVFGLMHIYTDACCHLHDDDPDLSDLHHMLHEFLQMPRALLGAWKTMTKHELRFPDDQCAICLGGYSFDDEMVALLPCTHAFHKDCVFTWLYECSSCPLCRVKMDSVRVLTTN